MIWLDLSHDSWENVGLFLKIAATVLDIWFDTSSERKWSRCNFQVPDRKVKKYFELS